MKMHRYFNEIGPGAIALFAALIFLPSQVFGKGNYEIPASLIDNGGGTSSSNLYVVTSFIGEAAANDTSLSANFQVESGFKYMISELSFVGVAEYRGDRPSAKVYSLFQNHPNPFYLKTEIQYVLPIEGEVTISIYNQAGQKVKTLVHEKKTAGSYVTHWDSRDANGKELISGIYFYKIRAADFTQTRKMVLLR